MEDINDLLYDDVEAKYLALQNKKKNSRKKKRKKRLLILLVALALAALYFISDFSKVKSLDVKGNSFYTKQMVLQKAGLTYDSRYIIIPRIYLEWKLEKDGLIEDAVVHKGMDGTISIEIKEKSIVGYYIDNGKNYALVNDGSSMEIGSAMLDTIVHYPLVDGFSAAERKKLAKSFGGKQKVDASIIAMISEMVPYETSYDKHMVKIIMQDGNTIFTSYESMPLLNDYLGTLKRLKKSNVCLWPDAATHSIHNENCSKKE